jgi:hypothetical protein
MTCSAAAHSRRGMAARTGRCRVMMSLRRRGQARVGARWCWAASELASGAGNGWIRGAGADEAEEGGRGRKREAGSGWIREAVMGRARVRAEAGVAYGRAVVVGSVGERAPFLRVGLIEGVWETGRPGGRACN